MKTAVKNCRVGFLRKIQSRLPCCHAAAIVRVSGGLGRFRVVEAPWKGGRSFYLDDQLLASGDALGCPTCQLFVHHGYGDGVMGPEERRRIGDALNAPYGGLEAAAGRLAPVLGLFESGYYILADCDQYPSVPSRVAAKDGVVGPYSDFITGGYPDFETCIRFMGGHHVDEFHNVPLFLWASQRPSSMNWRRVTHYMELFGRGGPSLPRPVAVYMNGGMSMVLDGHHKIAAAAMLGMPVRTTVIFRIERPREVLPVLKAADRLFLCARGSTTWLEDDEVTGRPVLRYDLCGGPPYLCDKNGRMLSEVSCWGNSHAEPPAKDMTGERPVWQDDECEFLRNYHPRHDTIPCMGAIEAGAHVDLGRIRESLGALRKANELEENDPEYGRGNDWRMLGDLLAFKRLYPSSKWISAEDYDWLVKTAQFGERQDMREWGRFFIGWTWGLSPIR